MMRVALLLLLSLPLAQGFGVAPRPAFRPSAVYAETPEKEIFASYSSVDESAIEKEPYFIGEEKDAVIVEKEEPSFALKKDELSAKAQHAMKEISSKADDLLKDPKLQELSGKATEFTKDFFGNIFSPIGNKLKELKEEKEKAKSK